MMFFIFILGLVFSFFILVCTLSFTSFNSSEKPVRILTISLIFTFVLFFVFFMSMFSNPYLIPRPFFTVYSTSYVTGSFLGLATIGFSILYLIGPFNQFSSQNFIGFFFYLVAISSSFVLVISSDFIIFIILSELLAISAYLLIFFNNTSSHFASSFKYLIINAVGTLFILLSLTFAHFYFGVNNFSDLLYIFENAPIWVPEIKTGYTIFQFFFWLGLFVKFGLFPFHYWVFPVYEHSSKFSVIFFSTFLKLPFFPIMLAVIKFSSFYVVVIIYTVGFFSVVYSAFFAFRAFVNNSKFFSFRRLMAYSSINNFGLIFLALPFSEKITLYYLFTYILSTILLFIAYFDIANSSDNSEILSFSAVDYHTQEFDKPYVVAYKHSYFVFVSSIILASGLPIFGMFFPKFALFSTIITEKASFFSYQYLLSIILLFSSFLFTYLYYKFTFDGWFNNPELYPTRFINLKVDNKKDKFRRYLRLFTFIFFFFFLFFIPIFFYIYLS